jgi:hypothetical protein
MFFSSWLSLAKRVQLDCLRLTGLLLQTASMDEVLAIDSKAHPAFYPKL